MQTDILIPRNSEENRYKRKALNEQRTKEYKSGNYVRGGGVVDPLPEDASVFVKDYYDYCKTNPDITPNAL